MKKLLTIFGSFTATMSSTFAGIYCAKKEDNKLKGYKSEDDSFENKSYFKSTCESISNTASWTGSKVKGCFESACESISNYKDRIIDFYSQTFMNQIKLKIGAILSKNKAVSLNQEEKFEGIDITKRE